MTAKIISQVDVMGENVGRLSGAQCAAMPLRRIDRIGRVHGGPAAEGNIPNEAGVVAMREGKSAV